MTILEGDEPLSADDEQDWPGRIGRLPPGAGAAAFELLARAGATARDDARSLALMAADYLRAGALDLAEGALTLALARAPALAIARFQLGLLRYRTGRPRAAIATWAALEALPAGDPLLLFKRGLEALAHERPHDAQRWLAAGLQATPSNEALNGEMRGLMERIAGTAAVRASHPGPGGRWPLTPHAPELLAETRARDGRPRYCTYPFRHFAFSSTSMMACPWLRRVHGVSAREIARDGIPDLRAVWHGAEFENVRRSVAAGDYAYCNLQHCPELKGEQEYFLTTDELRERYPEIARFVSGQTRRYEGGPELLNVQYDATCNLACPSCNRLQAPRLDRATLERFAEAMVQLGSDLRYILLAGMGDPFGSPHYHEWLCTVDLGRFPALRQVLLSTNALRWTEEAWRRIPQRTRIFIRSVVVSMDGASPETVERNRYPARFADQMDRLRYVASLRRAGELDRLRVYFVYQENNFHEMPRMVALCRELGVDSVFFARLSNWNGVPHERFAPFDVGNPDHPRHRELLDVAAETAQLGDDRLEVVLMRC